jgi:hypothetical protein
MLEMTQGQRDAAVSRVLIASLLFGVSVYMLAPPVWSYVHLAFPFTDYNLHAGLADTMRVTGRVQVPHFLTHLLAIELTSVFPITTQSAIGWIAIVGLSMSVALTYWYLSETNMYSAVAGAIAVSLFHPLVLHNLHYLGNVVVTTFHNPTYALLKPLAMLQFMILLKGLKSEPSSRWTVLSALTLVVATLAKPNYTVCLLPACTVFLFISSDVPWQKNFKFLIWAALIPGVLVLGWQYWYTYATNSSPMERSTIVFAPFEVLLAKTGHIPLKTVMSLAFPLSVLALFGRKAFLSKDVRLGFFVFLFGVVGFYLFAESGNRKSHMNLAWGAYIGLYILVVTLVKLLSDQMTHLTDRRTKIKWSICVGLLFLHAVSGVIWFRLEYLAPYHYW